MVITLTTTHGLRMLLLPMGKGVLFRFEYNYDPECYKIMIYWPRSHPQRLNSGKMLKTKRKKLTNVKPNICSNCVSIVCC